METSALTSSCPSDSPFLPFHFPHQYGFSLPLIFSFLPLKDFTSLLQVTKNSTWNGSLTSASSINHFSHQYDINVHDPYPFFSLSPFLLFSIRHFTLSAFGVKFDDEHSHHPHGDRETHLDVHSSDSHHQSMTECQYVNHHSMEYPCQWMKRWRQIGTFLHENTRGSHSPLSLTVKMIFTNHFHSNQPETNVRCHYYLMEFIDGMVREVKRYQSLFRTNGESQNYNENVNESNDPLPNRALLCIHFRTLSTLNHSSFQSVDPSFLLLLSDMKVKCDGLNINLMVTFDVTGIGQWTQMMNEKVLIDDVHHDSLSLSSSLSPFPSVTFQSLSSFLQIHTMTLGSTELSLQNQNQNHHDPISMSLPLACPLLKKIHFVFYYEDDEISAKSSYGEIGNIIENTKSTLTSISISFLYDGESNVQMVQSLLRLPFITEHLPPSSSYPNITLLDITHSHYISALEAYIRQHDGEGNCMRTHFASFNSFMKRFPCAFSQVKLTPQHFLWYFIANCPHIQSLPFLSTLHSIIVYPHWIHISPSSFFTKNLLLFFEQLTIYASLSYSLEWNGWDDMDINVEDEDVGLFPSIALFDPILSAMQRFMGPSLTSLKIPMDSSLPLSFLSHLSLSLSHCPKLNHLDLTRSDNGLATDSGWCEDDIRSLYRRVNNGTHPLLTSLRISKMSECAVWNDMVILMQKLPLLRSLYMEFKWYVVSDGYEIESESGNVNGDGTMQKPSDSKGDEESEIQQKQSLSPHDRIVIVPLLRSVVYSLSHMSNLTTLHIPFASFTHVQFMLTHPQVNFISTLCQYLSTIQRITFEVDYTSPPVDILSFLSLVNQVITLLKLGNYKEKCLFLGEFQVEIPQEFPVSECHCASQVKSDGSSEDKEREKRENKEDKEFDVTVTAISVSDLMGLKCHHKNFFISVLNQIQREEKEGRVFRKIIKTLMKHAKNHASLG